MFGGKKKKTEGNESRGSKSKNVAKKSKIRNIKPKAKRPVARTISLILALLMLLGFVVPSGISVWNMFFGAKLNNMDFNDEKTQRLLQELAEISKKHQSSEGESSDENGSVDEDVSGQGNESNEEDESGEGDVAGVESVETEVKHELGTDESDEE